MPAPLLLRIARHALGIVPFPLAFFADEHMNVVVEFFGRLIFQSLSVSAAHNPLGILHM